MVFLLVLAIGCFLIWWFFGRKSKSIKCGSLSLVTGGVKCGKSTTAVYLAIKEYKRVLFGYKIANFLCKIFKKPIPEKPLLYSNVPLNVKFGYVPLTEELLLRKERFAYKSVIYINECSLLHDKDIYKQPIKSITLSLFYKLIGHSTKGGCVILDTQSIGDLPVVVRRCLNSYIYVHHLVKWIPFYVIAYVREERFSEDNSMNVYNSDVEKEFRRVVIPKSTWKKFDCYCFSSFTDALNCDTSVQTADSLKVKSLVTFNQEYNKFLEVKKENEEK